MSLKQLVDKILITLEVGDSTPVFILLSREGIIHRKGNGNPAADLPLKQGYSADGHFEALLMTIDETIFQYAGIIRLPRPMGRESRLTIIFQGRGDGDISFRVVYGSESEGPPQELAEILINAVKLTDKWYNEQLALTEKKKEKWWQIWK